MEFSQKIIQWYRTHKRSLPWRETNDPYAIWVSEVILQQTRVGQGLPYYIRFLDSFPTVSTLAEADEAVLLREWQGLGYYSRARNMHKAAKMVVNQLKGKFPTDFNTLLTLPGVGPYTAAAISSFAAGECQPVVDGNVSRVLSRYFNILEPVNSGKGQDTLKRISHELIPNDTPAEYNQAIMEFGALQCIPRNPDCRKCVLQSGCGAFEHRNTSRIPVKIRAKAKRNRYFHYFILRDAQGKIRIQQRQQSDIWQGLFELPLIEHQSFKTIPELCASKEFKEQIGKDVKFMYESKVEVQILSHQKIFAKFFEVENTSQLTSKNRAGNYVFIKELDNLAKPKLIVSFLNKYFNKKV